MRKLIFLKTHSGIMRLYKNNKTIIHDKIVTPIIRRTGY